MTTPTNCRRSVVMALIWGLTPLAACGQRATPSGDASTDRLASRDHGAPPGESRPVLERGPGDAAGDVMWNPQCSKPVPVRAAVGGEVLQVKEVKTGTTMTQCCTGELIRWRTTRADGTPLDLTLSMLRFPGTTTGGTAINLASPPTGWIFGVRCDPYAACGDLNATNADFTGTIQLQSSPGAPALQASVCLIAQPRSPEPPLTSVRLEVTSTTIHTACTFGMDQTCNFDPLVSSIRGKCSEDGTCTCNAGAQPTANGKCK